VSAICCWLSLDGSWHCWQYPAFGASIVTPARRGTLVVGKLADRAVLSKDYLSVAVDEIGGIRSLLALGAQARGDGCGIQLH
jgi:hypothetical protein